jgi:transposase-like protein
MVKKDRKSRVDTVSKRKPWQRLDEGIKSRIVTEVISGSIGYRAACRKYKIRRTVLNKWIQRATVNQLMEGQSIHGENPLNSVMNQSEPNKALLQGIKALRKQLEQANLKIESLETLIVVAEEELKIKIRKKRGTKQSRECDKAIQK